MLRNVTASFRSWKDESQNLAPEDFDPNQRQSQIEQSIEVTAPARIAIIVIIKIEWVSFEIRKTVIQTRISLNSLSDSYNDQKEDRPEIPMMRTSV